MKNIWLSHIIERETPLFGGQKDGIRIAVDNSISGGDPCNTSNISMPVHAGTHVDAPLHFLAAGQAIVDLPIETWLFQSPAVVNMQVAPGQIIQPDDLLEKLPVETDLCLFRTGFEAFRRQAKYWKAGPGIGPSVASALRKQCPNLRAVGMDFISISSLKARDIGRAAHRAFLEMGILLIEDMKLGEIINGLQLLNVICLPLRVSKGDGAPCTVLGVVTQGEDQKTED